MKPCITFLIAGALSVSGCRLGAQDNPFMRMAGINYADYSQELYDRYLDFCRLDTADARKVILQMDEVADKTGRTEWRLQTGFFDAMLFGINRSEVRGYAVSARSIIAKRTQPARKGAR